MLDENSETFVVHIASFNLAPGIYPDKTVQIASLLTEKVKILDKYSDFADILLEKKALVLPKRNELNEHVIDLKDSKQPLYRPINSLGRVELEILKTYIKTNLKTGFIWLFKFPASPFILFNKKPDSSFCLLPSPLDQKLDRLGRARRFTQLDLTNAY